MGPQSAFFTLDGYGTARPMLVPVPSYTNETNTAQSIPMTDRAGLARAGIRKAGFAKVVKPTPNPANPAAPDPKTTVQDTSDKAKRSPLVWIGLAAGVFVLFWAVRHHAG